MKTQIPNQLRHILPAWLVLCLLAFSSPAQTGPCCSPPTGLTWLQPPDFTASYNALMPTTANPYLMGDDFPCTNSDPITDIRLWGSFYNDNDQYLGDLAFTLTIWSDVPGASSHPDTALWTQTFQPSQYDWCTVTNTFGVVVTPNWLPSGNGNYTTNLYYLCFTPPATNRFVQSGSTAAPTNYWLTVSTQVQGVGDATQFGWKLSGADYRSTVVYNQGDPGWTPLYNTNFGGGPINFAFQVTTATNASAYLPALTMRQLSRTNCVITWTTGILQVCSLPDLSTVPQSTYTDIPGAISPYTNTTSLSAQFYRLRSN
jgi:hypothetical protein